LFSGEAKKHSETALEMVAIPFGGLDLVPDVSGAIWVPSHASLLVADLHLEKASAFAARGVHLPPYDTRSTLNALKAACERWNPQLIISLGDSFHDDGARARMDASAITEIRTLTTSHEFVWITGNHDETPPEDLGGQIAGEFDLGGIILRHIPSEGLSFAPEIAGHLHPVATVARRGRRLRRRCFASDGKRFVMPAFGALTGGLNVRSEAFNAVFPDGCFTAWLLGRDQVYPFSSRKLLPAKR
jgi:DNA ligase-associated metallophosphoesterase